MAKDRCYHKVKKSYKKFPSARASQAIAKCRGKSGKVRKTKKGAALKRWEKEKWKDTKTGKPCGAGGKILDVNLMITWRSESGAGCFGVGS